MSGYFDSGLIINDDGPNDDGLDIVIYVLTWNWAVQVINQSGIIYYERAGPWNNLTDGTLLNVTGRFTHGAWMIFSYHNGITDGWNYLNSSVNYVMPMATAVWPYNTTDPFYDAVNETIFLPDWAVHPDITLHEYAHYVMNITYGYMPPAGEYSINGTSDANTAWVEGWAFFFPLIVQNDSNFLDLNLETPHWCSPNWDDGDRVVGRMAGALWDISDSNDDGYDVLDDGFHRIWNITRDQNPDTFKEFWDSWNTTYYTHPKTPSSPYDLQDWNHTLRAIFQNSIDYRGPGDVNVDGKCDIEDVYIAADLFGAAKGKPGPPEFDQLADFNYDDKIDIEDIFFIALHNGATYDC